MTGAPPYRVTFVCTGNICRSPMGEVVLTAQLHAAGLDGSVLVDSAGTGDWHVGDGADPRTVTTLAGHGYDGGRHRAQQFRPDWFAERDLVLAADRSHLAQLHAWAHTAEHRAKVRLMREFDPEAVAAADLEVDDPWFGDERDFERCFTEVDAVCRGLVEHLRGIIATRA